MLKILVVSKYDKDGGATIAAYRMHKSLLSSGVHSRMLVQKKVTGDYTVGRRLLRMFYIKNFKKLSEILGR